MFKEILKLVVYNRFIKRQNSKPISCVPPSRVFEINVDALYASIYGVIFVSAELFLRLLLLDYLKLKPKWYNVHNLNNCQSRKWMVMDLQPFNATTYASFNVNKRGLGIHD